MCSVIEANLERSRNKAVLSLAVPPGVPLRPVQNAAVFSTRSSVRPLKTHDFSSLALRNTSHSWASVSTASSIQLSRPLADSPLCTASARLLNLLITAEVIEHRENRR